MFEFLRNLRKSAEERRQEALSAYLDGASSPSERRRFEQQMAADPDLQAAYRVERLIKERLSQLPRQKAPRTFTLDPAHYGAPARHTASVLYPALRTATIVAAFVFVIALALDLGSPIDTLSSPASQDLAEEVALSEVTRVEEQEIESVSELPAAGPAPEIMAQEAEVVVEMEGEAVIAAEEVAEEVPEEESVAEEMLAAEAPADVASEEVSGQEAGVTEAQRATVVKTEEPAMESAAAAEAEPAQVEEAPLEATSPLPAPTPSMAVVPTETLPTSTTESVTEEDLEEDGAAFFGEATDDRADEAGIRPSETLDDQATVSTEDAESQPLPTLRLVQIALGAGVIILAAVTILLRQRL